MLRNFTLKIGLVFFTLFLLMLSTQSVYSSEVRDEGTRLISVSEGTSITQFSSSTTFFEDFEGATFPPEGWAVYSQLDDSLNWELNPWSNYTPGGSQSAYHNMTSQPESVDNWFVTPQISIGTDGFHQLSFWSFLGSSWAYKKNSVLVSTGSPDPADGDYVEKWAGISNDGWMWAHFFVNLEDYIGQDVYIAFRYEGDTWGHTWNIDDIAIVDESPIFTINVTELSQALGANGTGVKTIEITNDGIQDLTFDIELEYVDSDGWLTVTPPNGIVTSQSMAEITVDFNAAGLDYGIYTANLNITTNDPANPTATVVVTLEVIDVNVYPFVEDFESENFLPIGWSNYNIDADETEWVQSWFNNTPGGQFSAYHGYGWTPQDGWMVTPQITVPAEGFYYLSFWSLVGDAQYYGKNSVLISTGSGDPNDAEFVEVWTVAEESESIWTQYFINIEDYAGQDIYIAFRYEGEYAHYWAIDDISLGEEIDDSPIMNVSLSEIAQTVGQDGSSSKSFKVMNDGIQNLTFDIEVEFTDGDGWLTAEPISGSIPAKSSQNISLAFDATGLEIGVYQANVTITSNDTENPTATVVATLNVMESQPVNLTVIYPGFTVPTRISTDGKYVSGSQFGGMEGYLWTRFENRVDITGDISGVSDNGLVVGTYDTEFEYEGGPVQTAGIWNKTTQEWEFLGMNPEIPEIFGASYNSAWSISADGSTIVGLQFNADWSASAFKWTEADGYEMIGPAEGSSRASGISDDGSVIYGWAAPNWSWSPVVWHNDEMIFIDETLENFGESTAASASGNYVAGYYGTYGFIWSPTEGVTQFENTLNAGTISPTAVLEDGTVFGYTSEGFPPTPDTRLAFVRHPDGTIETFNEYVASRGWFDASDWTFFMVNDVTPDGNQFVGGAALPNGDLISFLLDLNPGTPTIEVDALEVDETLTVNSTSTQTINIENIGTGYLIYDAVVQYTIADPKVRKAPAGAEFKSGDLDLGRSKVAGKDKIESNSSKTATILNYDGDNIDAIGLMDGGTFYGAARFPSEMVAIFENYDLESVDVYIGDVPTEIKLKVWGAGTTTTVGDLLFEQTFTATEDSWNTVTLDNPVVIDGTDIWVGFEITHTPSAYVLGLGDGATVQDGNWLSLDAAMWEHLSDYGLEGNWNIRANLSFGGMDWLSISPTSGILEESISNELTLEFTAEGLEVDSYTANIRVSSNDAENPLVIIPITLNVEPLSSVDDMNMIDVSIYPNPASSIVNIVAQNNIIKCDILNMLGQIVYSTEVNNSKATLELSSINNGMYLIQVVTIQGVYTQRLQVNK